MLNKLPSLYKLIKALQQIPYLASKNIYKAAAYFLDLDGQKTKQFCEIILEAKKNIDKCSICFFWKEKKGQCIYCASPERNKDIICVVETWQELISIERTGGYIGVYHILGGAICPLNGIGPENLTINALINRINSNTKEVIFATNQTPEGEATASFIANKIKNSNVKITCLARGIPVGTSLEYMDKVTLYKALSERKNY